MRILLGQNRSNPNSANKYGQTPFYFSRENRHEEVTRILLEQNHVNPSIPDEAGRAHTSGFLPRISMRGESMVLLEWSDVNPDPPDLYC